MKRNVLLILVLFVSLSMFSQKSHRTEGWKLSKDISKNELKLNVPIAIFCSFPEISYERLLNSDISVGASAGVGFNNDNHPLSWEFMPYFRWFFGGNSKSLQKYAAGFFIEVNGALMGVNEGTDSLFGSKNTTDTDTEFGAGLGVAIGWKYLSKNNWIGEVLYGAGRDFSNDGVYPRIGISIGKRF